MSVKKETRTNRDSGGGSGDGAAAVDAAVIHESNRRGWDAASPGWQAMIDERVDWRGCATDPAIALDRKEIEFLGDMSGKEVCVLGSGDNLVVFALSGMGARVTSVDISQAQLDTAAARAGELGLDVRFVRADVVDLRGLDDERFDVVYTGGHVAAWVADLKRYYSEACRILKRGGALVVSEYHPFRRIWREPSEELKVESGYFDRGPYSYDRAGSIPGAPAGSLPSYEFNWTVADYVSAVMEACELTAVDEFGDRRQRWENAPMDGLPYYLLLRGRKR